MTMNLKVLSPRPDEAAMKSSSPFLAICLAATPQRSQEAITIFEGLTGICRPSLHLPGPTPVPFMAPDPSINFTGQTAGRFVAPESCSDEVAVVLLINAAAGTAPFVRNLPILVLQFEPEVSTGTELQGKVLCHSKWDSSMCGLCLEDASHLEGLPVKLSENLPTRQACPWGDDVAPTPPASAAYLMLSGGCIHTRTQTAQRILRRAASIMLRRLDAVRERLAESSALESLLTARNS